MSENIPAAACSSPQKKPRRRYDKQKLPTPPPDPNRTTTDERDDFLAYLDSLPKGNLQYSRSASTFAPAIATEDAFDHLEKLYKLMEQMLELREQNAKLHRRVRDLEHLNNLEKMHRQLDINSVQGECPELDKDTAFAETILESILAEAKGVKQKPSASSRLRQSISRRNRNRSGSVSVAGLEKGHLEVQVKRDRRASADTCVKKPSAKVSKWTKVKAAFKWEKASPTVSDAKSQDSGIGGFVPLEETRYLRVPSTVEDHGHSPVDSGAAEISTPGSLSTASSTEDFNRHDLRSPCEELKSSDDEHSQNYIPHSKDGSQKSSKSYKTPWAKMKGIIQTRNSFKKKHRLSAHSDDIQIDIELCSDNEEVFEDEDKCKLQSSSPRIYKRSTSNDIPPEVVARYQQAIAEDADLKKSSRWTRVKKAFLTSHEVTQTPQKCRQEDDKKILQDEIQRNYQQLQKKISLEFQEKLSEWDRTKQNSPGISNPSTSSALADETKDPAFMKKMEEWQKIKSQPPKNRPSLPLQSEENLPPEFRKKLQEWEKIRKAPGPSPKKKLSEVPRWKSLSGPRTDTSPPIFEYPQISEDFKKKLEEWKQIKAGTFEPKSSPRLSRKDSSPKHGKKQRPDLPDKELQWFEKIEKEKQRLEGERQRFLEREESLAKLRTSVLGGLKKEVLIHTPSGFYRFEGISRKFTQKLYEWEKAQGIGPESSTFALLNSSLNQEPSKSSPERKTPGHTSSLVRSKSADSIAISALNLACPLMSHQPSSLSLNDVDELEKECLADSKSSSFINNSRETLPNDEPEAIIVEVEDIIEETAAPLHAYAQRTQQPVYQRQELKAMCEGETCAAPKVRRSESTRAQSNYNLIEEIFNLLKNIGDNELEIQKTQEMMAEQEKKSNSDIIKLKMFDESQKSMVLRLTDKLVRLQEANSNVFSNMTREDSEFSTKHVVETLETVQDLSLEIFQQVEKLEMEITKRNVYDIFKETGARALNPITEMAKETRNKMLELRRRLSYICAATDLTAPRRKHSCTKTKVPVRKTLSNESSTDTQTNTDISRTGSEKVVKEGRLYVKSETSNAQSQGAIKKRIRYRQKNLQNKPIADSDEEEETTEQKRNTHKKLTRTRSTSESSTNKFDGSNREENEEIVVDETIVQKLVVPTQTTILNLTSSSDNVDALDSPVTLFVKTTRKLFTPIVESGLSEKNPQAVLPSTVKEPSPSLDTNSVTVTKENASQVNKIEEIEQVPNDSKENSPQPSAKMTPVTHLPPLPASPVPQRKPTKDISPSIKLMLAKYNQKISEQDSTNTKSRGRSGSVSPLPWRSPSSERRVKAQTERYQEELRKFGGGREVQKSASVGFLHKEISSTPRRDLTQPSVAESTILKSSSVSALSTRRLEPEPKKSEDQKKLTLTISKDNNSSHSPEIRQKKMQKAKEEFMKSPPPPQASSAPAQLSEQPPIRFPSRNRLSQISVDSESSYESACAGALIKSASAGMINIDAEVYRQIDPEVHGRGYVSLPRSTKKQKQGFLGGKFAFSNIASKFRKVRMRKGKDKDAGRMNTVSTLCRQSLVVDIQRQLDTKEDGGADRCEEEAAKRGGASSSEDLAAAAAAAAATSKTGSWMRKHKLFKK